MYNHEAGSSEGPLGAYELDWQVKQGMTRN